VRRGRRLVGCAGLFGLSLLAAGCGGGDAPPSRDPQQASTPTAGESRAPAGQGLAIDFRSEPDPPESGDNALEVAVKRADGSPVTDATVTVTFSMPAMPSMNMPAMRSAATLAHEASGRYRGTGQLSMDGTWNVLVTVTKGPDELGRKSLSVVAK